jgi:nitroreductase/NAD-dependent dihydropyrimidine dehydrogenase PreA subunit
MGLLNIDETKCNREGLCVRECPMAIIKLKDREGFPEIVPGDEDMCNDCGHCIAICPYGALDHARVLRKNSPLIEKDLKISENQAVQFLRSRRSIRFFKDLPVEREKLQRLIEIGRYAPTAGNRQLVEWVVLTDPDTIKGIAEMTVEWMREALEKYPQSVPPYFPLIVRAWDKGYNSVTWSAPALVLASAPKEATSGMVDVSLALCYFELAAPNLGLGTCWAGLVNGAMKKSAAVRDAMGLPEGHPHYYSMMIGYPKRKYSRVPERKPPKITWK